MRTCCYSVGCFEWLASDSFVKLMEDLPVARFRNKDCNVLYGLRTARTAHAAGKSSLVAWALAASCLNLQMSSAAREGSDLAKISHIFIVILVLLIVVVCCSST